MTRLEELERLKQAFEMCGTDMYSDQIWPALVKSSPVLPKDMVGNPLESIDAARCLAKQLLRRYRIEIVDDSERDAFCAIWTDLEISNEPHGGLDCSFYRSAKDPVPALAICKALAEVLIAREQGGRVSERVFILKEVQRDIESKDVDYVDLLYACFPDSDITLPFGPEGGVFLRGSDDVLCFVNPLLYLSGAKLLAQKALPGQELTMWARPEGCEQKCHIAGATGVAKTMPWAICLAVVNALIAQEEREAVG